MRFVPTLTELDFLRFEPFNAPEGGDQVVAPDHIKLGVKANDRRFRDLEATSGPSGRTAR